MRQVIYLKVLANTFYLDLIRKVTSNIAVKGGLEGFDECKLVTAVDEVCANIIEHSYGNGFETMKRNNDCRDINLTYMLRKKCICVNIFDNGKEFDFNAGFDLERHLKEMNTDGLGLYMIKTLVDKLSYRHVRGRGNLLRLIKYFNESR